MNDFVIDKPGRYITYGFNMAYILYATNQHEFGGYIINQSRRGHEIGAWYGDGRWIFGQRPRSGNSTSSDIREYLGPLQPGDDGFGGGK